ncbi:hypothetical protein TWF106_009031 [Orbilia oligospora]|uniref:Uncharacterized protein n=2 Tax=Orbilia oligospora TaxID=2813651 RepID=A0A6G1M064_ORBOL|nr:hypothetical protein TWF788_008394 [Orbilia oligospora]KAF3199219.1 hypothetical protein TWF191_004578 [Orbilia oligospora]KAF3208633.1 hypothetical protein TWF679_007692 [Orbilia oligospora]KAF3214338.1 hypothetical protein TWF106_009031 [Orbilia oligospora]KAF3238103.1 hypothetical protein TWF192_010685 [Orbilia oligospora]
MNSNSNDKSTSMRGMKEGMRGVDHEDNPMPIPERRKSWTDRMRETMGFHTGSAAQHSTDKPITQQAQMKVDSAIDDMKQTMDSTETGAKVHRRGSEILEEVKKEAIRREIGGSQLFGSPRAAKREATAANSFLTKYANESAPGENTA